MRNPTHLVSCITILCLAACGGTGERSEESLPPLSVDDIEVPTSTPLATVPEIFAVATAHGTNFEVGPLNADGLDRSFPRFLEQLPFDKREGINADLVGREYVLGWIFKSNTPGFSRHFYLTFRRPVGQLGQTGIIPNSDIMAGFYLYPGEQRRSDIPPQGFGHRVFPTLGSQRYGKDEVLLEITRAENQGEVTRYSIRFDMRIRSTYAQTGYVRIRGSMRLDTFTTPRLD